ncbi:MAG: TolC family protein, partial [Nitrosomonas halophila]
DTVYALAKEEIQAGNLGEIISMHAKRNLAKWITPSHLQKLSALFGDGVHDFDLMLWYTGGVDEGLTAAIEISRAEIGVTDRVESLIIANTKLKLSQRQLKFLLNDQTYTIDSDIHIVPTTTPTLVYYNLDRKQIASLALDGRLELLELELRLAADLTRIEFLENQTLPLFTLDYSYGALSNSRGSFSQTYEDVVRNRFNDWSIGLRFELPMTNEARRMQLQRAVQQRIQRLTTKTLQEQVVLREIYDVFDQVEQNWQRILATRQQVILAGINYEAELKQFKEGLRTMTEVLEMLTLLGEAQIKEINAVRDYQAALIDLAYATGTLLGYSRVEF